MSFKMPHTLTLLFFLMVAALAATWIIPQGSFQTELNEAGREVVMPGTYETSERVFLSPMNLFTGIPRAFAAAQDIIFFLFIIGGVLAIIRKTGTIDALLGRLLENLGDKPQLMIFTVIFVFAVASSAMGASGEYIPFILILVALCRAMNLDAMTAVGIVVAGYGIGYGTAAFNQYTVVVAQGVADLPTYSGWQLRAGILLPFVAIGAHHVWSYARKVQLDPSASLMQGIKVPEGGAPPKSYPDLTVSHILILISFFAALGTAVWGIATRGWYLTELGAAFVILGIVTALIGRIGPSVTAKEFVGGAMNLTETALLVGVARGIALMMEDGQILHTIVHYLSIPLSVVGPEIAGVGMMIMQTLLNLFVPSGSGQAFVTMPLMAPLSDLLGISRQVAVLAFLFGDGFANMLVPTNAVLMGILGMAGVPYDRWFRFCFPLLLKLLGAGAVVIILAIVFGYS
ncbi:putative membrane protein YfcC, ion transporter superfamily [Cyclonatronum proteinivorum]|uniref:Putative membrane protein YfcC, ion transporter superfamily n=2 Tax=Cyclonatronum proteinivorum TaxID=1457365 RepID=A0A345UGQ5_9BACT|nr:putative membrane protein YfcC, ion transporter superfamily [Cyclonatronum proteinivorum]